VNIQNRIEALSRRINDRNRTIDELQEQIRAEQIWADQDRVLLDELLQELNDNAPEGIFIAPEANFA